MKITTIGCGNAFSNKSYNQSFLVEEGGRKMLIDCGMQIGQALANAGLKPQDIDDIYISHAHADHAGGLEYFAFLRYDWVKRPRRWDEKLALTGYSSYAPRLIANEQLMKDLWTKTLCGGLESMEGFVATMETFFEPVPIAPNKSFEWQGWTVDLIQQVHVMSGSVIMPSFGIMFRKEGHKSVYFVTDSQHCSPRQMEEYYRRADIIFQDCECSGVDFSYPEGRYVYSKEGKTYPWPTSTEPVEAMSLIAEGVKQEIWGRYKFGSGVHANYAQLAGYDSANSVKLPAEIRKKMWLSHYQDFVLSNKDMFGNDVNWNEVAIEDGFAGFVKVGMTFEV